MKIHIRDIPEEGLALNSTFPNDLIDKREDDGLTFIEPLDLHLKVYKAQDELIVHIGTRGKFHAFCSRCLTDVKQDYKTQADLFYQIESRGADFIDITEDLRQEILLNLPDRVLCCKDCQGICPQCGTNLNENKCNCKE